MLKTMLNWAWPVVMLALGIYLLSGSVLTLIYGGMLGVGAFTLGVRVWSRVSDDFQARTEAIVREYGQGTPVKESTVDAPESK